MPVQSGIVISVPAGGDFQGALNAATCGDTIQLAAGATFTGAYTLPNKSCTGWVIIRTSTPDSGLPAQGTRITPSFASVMPKIQNPSTTDISVSTLDGAHNYRFIGVEFKLNPSFLISAANVIIDNATLAHDITFDRCYFHGEPATTQLRRGLIANGAAIAVIDSYFASIYTPDTDSQAIGIWNSSGPLKFVNNYLEAAGENILFGGAGSQLVPSDIEIRHNWFRKPLSWKANDPSYDGVTRSIKNLLEFKFAQRVLVDGNIFENNWLAAQSGTAIVFTPRFESGNAPNAVDNDITFTHNIVRHSGSGAVISGTDDTDPAQIVRANRILISDTLFDDINGCTWTSVTVTCADGRLFLLEHGGNNETIQHVTGFQSGVFIYFAYQPPTLSSLVYRNNIEPSNTYGLIGDGIGQGSVALNAYAPGYVFTNNVIEANPGVSYPAGQFFPADWLTVQFVNFNGGNGGDYHLQATSPYKNAATDGKDIGADIDAILAATAGVIVP